MAVLPLFAAAFLLASCSGIGELIVEEPSRAHHPPDSLAERNPSFIVVGDLQPGKRVVEAFLRRENWVTWNQALVPFYQAYLLGQGVVGAVNHLRHVPDYGERSRIMMRDAIMRTFRERGDDFVVLLGDIVGSDGRRPDHWEMFLDLYGFEGGFLDSIPVYTALGNHEVANDTSYGYPNYRKVFPDPRFYTLRFPDLALIILDSNYILDWKDHLPDARQDSLFAEWFVSGDEDRPAWLERELEATTEPYVLVIMHHSPLMLGWHFKDWYKRGYGPGLLEKRRSLLQLFADHGVQAVISGHEHYYQHNKLLLDSSPALDGEGALHAVISSSGGVPVRRAANEHEVEQRLARLREEGYDVRAVKSAGSFHLTRVSFEAGQLVLETIMIHESSGESSGTIESIRLAPRSNQRRTTDTISD